MKCLRVQDQPVGQLESGGGEGKEISNKLSPDGGVLWHVSVTIAHNARSISCFPGLDRTISVLDGEGTVLESESTRAVLCWGSEPFCFKGDAPLSIFSLRADTVNLSIMTRRGAYVHSVERHSYTEIISIDGKCEETVIVFNSEGRVKMPTGDFDVHRYDAIVGIERGKRLYLFPENKYQSESEVFIVRLEKVE